MEDFELEIKARVWIWEGTSPWYFVTIPKKESSLIRREFRHVHRGWGSIPVFVRIGKSNCKTSIFWEKKGTYILPIKKEIRHAEKITNGDVIKLSLLIENII
ncbi:MAG: DUF1905 domain-containing protein [Candidatus Levybacteria bacterium]|nr:DUF1905 domain-containing protein [Candidatus Levybacteria bacterium]